MTRRGALFFGAGMLSGSAAASVVWSRESEKLLTSRFQQILRVPPVLKPIRSDMTTDYYEIVQREAQIEIIPGLQTTLWGYEGVFPGPTIRAQRGRRVVVRHSNRLSVPSVVHLHGGVTSPESDGFPTDAILPGRSATYVYSNNANAATLWYHDHAMDKTGRNIYM